MIARIDEELRREHQGVDAGARHCDLVGIGFPVEPRDVCRKRFAQLRDAEVVRIEELTRADRFSGSLADERWRRLVRLSNPERKDVLSADTFVVELADPGGCERLDRSARLEEYRTS